MKQFRPSAEEYTLSCRLLAGCPRDFETIFPKYMQLLAEVVKRYPCAVVGSRKLLDEARIIVSLARYSASTQPKES